MHRFFVSGLNGQGKSINITGDDVNHIKNVLRLKIGEKVVICDENEIDNLSGREYHCVISDLSDDVVICDIVDICDNNAELKVKLTLFQGMPKGDKMELIIQKAVELGVYDIVPVMTKRTVVKLEPKKEKKKIERYNLIAEAAAKQSQRGIIPEVKGFMSFTEALRLASTYDMIIIPYEEAKGIEYSREVINSIKGKRNVGIFIGPEGGFAREEVDAALDAGAKAITLGNRILRTETAGLCILSIIGFAIEE